MKHLQKKYIKHACCKMEYGFIKHDYAKIKMTEVGTCRKV